MGYLRLETGIVLTLSTGHIRRETAKALENEAKCNNNEIPLVVYEKGEYGWFINVPDDFDYEEIELPSDLKRCIDLAKENSCDWLCLDRDGVILPTLLIYDWSEEKEFKLLLNICGGWAEEAFVVYAINEDDAYEKGMQAIYNVLKHLPVVVNYYVEVCDE